MIQRLRRRGLTLAAIARACGEAQSVTMHSLVGGANVSKSKADRWEPALRRLLADGEDHAAPDASPADDGNEPLRERLREALATVFEGKIPRLARSLGVTSADLKHALGGGAFSSELETAARTRFAMMNGPGASAGDVNARARALFDSWGARAIALVLAKAGKKMETE